MDFENLKISIEDLKQTIELVANQLQKEEEPDRIKESDVKLLINQALEKQKFWIEKRFNDHWNEIDSLST